MSRARPLLTILHPAAFAAGYVLLSFANLPTPAMGLWRPLAIAIVGARDVLERYLDFDNSEFEESLTALGFDVATDSRSNFSATWATLASMFHGAYLHDIDSLNPFPTDQTEQLRSLMLALNEGSVLADLRDRGYRAHHRPIANGARVPDHRG